MKWRAFLYEQTIRRLHLWLKKKWNEKQSQEILRHSFKIMERSTMWQRIDHESTSQTPKYIASNANSHLWFLLFWDLGVLVLLSFALSSRFDQRKVFWKKSLFKSSTDYDCECLGGISFVLCCDGLLCHNHLVCSLHGFLGQSHVWSLFHFMDSCGKSQFFVIEVYRNRGVS